MAENSRQLLDSSILSQFHDQRGKSLMELSHEGPMLVVFLRHSGCTFCKQALTDLCASRGKIRRTGSKLAIVHMESEEKAGEWLAQYDLEDVSRFSDPERKLYEAFDLQNGSLLQVAGPRVWGRGLKAMVNEGHLPGWPAGHELQMPGVFLIRDGRILRAFRHQSSADRPDYAEVAACTDDVCHATS